MKICASIFENNCLYVVTDKGYYYKLYEGADGKQKTKRIKQVIFEIKQRKLEGK